MANTSITVHGGNKMRRFAANLEQQSRSIPSVDIGFPATVTYADGKSVAMVATVNEFGLGVPERPFMRRTVQMILNDPAFMKLFTSLIDPTPSDRFRLQPWAWFRLGLYGQAMMQKSITDLKSPPNAPSTIARKGSSDPLIDTGHMRQSVSWRITPVNERWRAGRMGPGGSGLPGGGRGGRPRGFGGIRTRLYQAARFLGDIEAVRSGNIGGRFGTRGAGRFASRGFGGTSLFGGLGVGGGMGGGGGFGGFGFGGGYGGFGGGGGGISSVRSALYGTGKVLGDVGAVRSGTIGQRGASRITGRFTGRGIGRSVR